jgi:amino acid adenylation domain-containing protein
MKADALLEYLHQLGVELLGVGNRLRINAPEGVLTPSIRALLTQHKAEILELLLRQDGALGTRGETVPGENVSEMSFTQERLWFVDRLDPGSPAYNIPLALRICAPVQVNALNAALHEVVRRHEALRTVCRITPDGPRQQVLPASPMPLPVVDLTLLGDKQAEHKARDLAIEEFRKPFDLTRGPLLRHTLLQISAAQSILVLTMHHFVADGWSVQIVLEELATLYRVFSKGLRSPLPQPPYQFRDFVRWQRQLLQGENAKREMDYWKTRLVPSPPVLDLPTDRPRPAVQTFQGGTHAFELAANVSDRLKALARAERTTLFMALLAAFSGLLYRYTRQEDISIGTAVSNRSRSELERIIGPMSNNLVLRVDCSNHPCYRELLRGARQTAVEAFAHQDIPFEQIVKEIQPERDPSRNPMFQVMFMVQNTLQSSGAADTPFVLEDLDSGIVSFDLALALVDGSGLHGALQYNSDLFESVTAARFVEHFTILLAAAITRPDEPLAALPLLGEMERRQVLQEWTATEASFPRESLIQELVETQVEKTPHAVAVVFGEQRLTYRELNTHANQLARYLRGMGVRPETLVGICVHRSLEMVVGVLAILKAGGSYLPLDPSYPQERLGFMLNDARILHLLTQQALVAALPEHRAQRVLLDADWPAIAMQDGENPPRVASPSNLACVFYTSGSTGEPKGAMLSHRGLVNQLCWRQKTFQLGPEDSVLHAASFCFDVSLWDFFGPLIAGARIIMPQTEAPPDSNQIVRLIRRYHVTAMQLVTSRLQTLMQERGVETCKSMRCLITGGEVLSLDLQDRLLAGLTQNVNNLYGPAEASIDVTAWRCRQDASQHSVSIGRPIANQGIYLLDPAMQPVPLRVTGEIFVRGEGLARGYLRRPALTAERFVPDPFSAAPGSRLYRTGDQARWREDGNLEFLGRIDHQVKVRGLRIELEEIEAVLNSSSGVGKSVVMVREDQPGDQRVVAYLVPDGNLNVAQLRSALRRRLPLFMVPSAFVVLEAFPLTPNGKVDRRALPPHNYASETPYIAPGGPVEELVAITWAEVLAVPRVGIDDNFFELGGHSLLATKIISRLGESFGIEIPLRKLFEQPTVAALADHIRHALSSASGWTLPPLRQADRRAEIPLSFAQQRLWFLDQLGPDAPPNRIPSRLRLEGPLDVPALQRGLQEILRRHEALRTTFPSADGNPVQAIAPQASLVLPVLDLEGIAPDLQQEEVRRMVTDCLQRPWNLAVGPLFQTNLVRLGKQKHVLLLFVHHIIADGWSISILQNELGILYRSFRQGKESPLPELAFQYADYAAWQRNWLQGEVLAKQVEYWRRQLAGSEILRLPTDNPRPRQQTYRGQRRLLQFPGILTEQVAALSRREGVTPFMILLAAFMAVLHRYTRQDDISIGTPVAHRPKTELEGVIGLFLNTLVLRDDLGGNPVFHDFLQHIRDTCLNAYAHQDLPFEKLVQELNIERSLNRSPLFQVMFVLHNQPDGELRLENLQIVPEKVETGSVSFDLILSMTSGERGLAGSLEYNADLFDSSTADRMQRHFGVLLAAAVANPLTVLRELPLLTQDERDQILVSWNANSVLFDDGPSIHGLFEAQVERTPMGVALIQDQARLTYDQLNRRANRLAHRLRALGVRPETPVALCTERSIEMVVGLLGILKAGGVYVPIEPSYPITRIAMMLENAGIKLIVAQRPLPETWPVPDLRFVDINATEEPGRESEENPSAGIVAENLAYIIYTSGSTNAPKGVMVSHAALRNTLLWRRAKFSLSPSERILQNIPFTFDPSLWQILGTLISGAGLVLVRPEGHRDFPHLFEQIAAHEITITDFPPSLLQELLEGEEIKGCHTLRHIFVGGEVLSAELQQKFFSRSGAELHNVYGPTETAIDATCWTCRKNVATASVPIGRPIFNKEIYLLDNDLRPVPIGVSGELCIGGAGLARGYIGQPGLTAEKFIPHPFSSSGVRLYRTGDLARYRADGNIEFIGREDSQVKIRGLRIELEEIEQLLKRHPAVQEAVAVTSAWGKETRLVAYVTAAREGAGLASGELRSFLKDTLPESMLPVAYIVLEKLPRTIGGKVDRKALPAPEAQATVRNEALAPRNALERTIAEIWQEVLALPKVGVDDNFFDLGGHSLLLVRVHRRLVRELQLNLPVVDLFQYPTIGALAQHLTHGEPENISAERLQAKARQQRVAIAQQAHRRARRNS